MLYQDQTFDNVDVQLDGNEFRRCALRNCVLHYEGAGAFSFPGSTIHECPLNVTGAAMNTLAFLQELYAAGNRTLVEEIFEAIRSQKISSSLYIDRNLPGTLYKYVKREFVAGALNGEFRIGTLHDFRRQEDHGSEIGDAGEGTKSVYQHMHGSLEQIVEKPNLIGHMFATPNGGKIQFENCLATVNHDTPDLYAFCTSTTFDEQTMHAFQCDCCIEIVNPQAFFGAIDSALRERTLIGDGLVGFCVYTDRVRDIGKDDDVAVALIKPRKYEHQREVRALWKPRGTSITPLNIISPVAAQHIRVKSGVGS